MIHFLFSFDFGFIVLNAYDFLVSLTLVESLGDDDDIGSMSLLDVVEDKLSGSLGESMSDIFVYLKTQINSQTNKQLAVNMSATAMSSFGIVEYI